MVGAFGAIALAGNQIAMAVGSMLYMLPLGAAAAVGIRVAQASGAAINDRVSAIAVAGLGAVSFCMVPVMLGYTVGGRQIAAAFTDVPAVVETGAAILAVFGRMQLMDGVQSVSLGALRGLLDNRWRTRVSIIAYWLIALPMGWLPAHQGGLGATGICAGFGICLAVAATALAWRLYVKTAATVPVIDKHQIRTS